MSSNLEYYKVFYYVGQLGSITLAAEKLCISQPAVSQAIRQLELSVLQRCQADERGRASLFLCKIGFR